jgi:hypothetical protein
MTLCRFPGRDLLSNSVAVLSWWPYPRLVFSSWSDPIMPLLRRDLDSSCARIGQALCATGEYAMKGLNWWLGKQARQLRDSILDPQYTHCNCYLWVYHSIDVCIEYQQAQLCLGCSIKYLLKLESIDSAAAIPQSTPRFMYNAKISRVIIV